MNIAKPKCIIFDCDAILRHIESIYCQSLNHVVKKQGINYSLGAFYRDFHGLPTIDILNRLFLESKIAKTQIPIYNAAIEVQMLAALEETLLPKESFHQIFSQLCAAGFSLGVSCNQPSAKLKQLIRILELDAYFEDRVYSAHDIGCWKPEPDLFLYAAMQQGIAHDEILFIYDTINAQEAIRKSGLQGIFIPQFENTPTHLYEIIRANIDHGAENSCLVALKNELKRSAQDEHSKTLHWLMQLWLLPQRLVFKNKHFNNVTYSKLGSQ